MRDQFTRHEALALNAMTDQVDAKLAESPVEYTAADRAVLDNFQRAVSLAVPLIQARLGAEAFFRFVTAGRHQEAIASFYAKHGADSRPSAEECYQHFAACIEAS